MPISRKTAIKWVSDGRAELTGFKKIDHKIWGILLRKDTGEYAWYPTYSKVL